jgi:hypothetical protein
MYGYPRSSPSEILRLAGVLFFIFAFFLPIVFHAPFIHTLSGICGLIGAVLYVVGRFARVAQKPGWVSGFRAFAIIIGAIILPVVILWVYLKARSGR